jgi:excisionase family DNA binding protein
MDGWRAMAMDITELALEEGKAAEAAEAAATLQEYLQNHPEAPARLRLGDGDERQVLIPAAACAVFAAMLKELSEGGSVTVASVAAELTTQQAADLLNVSRPYLIGLLDRGEIPYRKVGNRRKIRMVDVMSYRRRDQVHRQAILDQLTEEAQELGLYD